MKSVHDLKHLVNASLDIVFPDSTIKAKLKSVKAAWRTQFKVDLSYMMVTRNLNFERCSFKFGWADGSPQGPFDFLLWKYRYILASGLLRTAEAMKTLTTTLGGSLGGKRDDCFEIPISTTEARRAANQVLKDNVREHLCVPDIVKTNHRLFVKMCFEHSV